MSPRTRQDFLKMISSEVSDVKEILVSAKAELVEFLASEEGRGVDRTGISILIAAINNCNNFNELIKPVRDAA